MKNYLKLGLKDYLALYQLSLRSYFWRVDGRQGIKGLWRGGCLLNCLYLFLIVMAYYFPLGLFILAADLVLLIPSLSSPFIVEHFGSIADLYEEIKTMLFVLAVSFPILFNVNRLKYSLMYTKSAWWKNTGIRPREIKSNKDLYGEYIATMAVEQALEKSKIYGRVLNSVIVPKHGDDFTEIDIVCVNETGIHVVEAKARGGVISGNMTSENWEQRMGSATNTMYNPIKQNQGHINFLTEYLYRNLVNTSTRNKATYRDWLVNVVLFADRDVSLQINTEYAPSVYFMGMAEGRNGYRNTDLKAFMPVRFSRREVDEIADALVPIASYTQSELDYMKRDREEKNSRRSRKNQSYYFVSDMSSVLPDGDSCLDTMVCRCSGEDSGNYLTFLDPRDGFFKAIPSAILFTRSHNCKRLEDAVGLLADW